MDKNKHSVHVNFTIQPPKAWQMDMSVIDEPYLYEELIVIAETRGKAKAKFLRKYRDSIVLRNGEELSFTKISVFLRKDLEPKFYNNEWITKAEFEVIKEEESRKKGLELLLGNESVEYCFIKKRGMYYRENCRGYTYNKLQAGVYSKQYAVYEAKDCSDLTIVPVYIENCSAPLSDGISYWKAINICSTDKKD